MIYLRNGSSPYLRLFLAQRDLSLLVTEASSNGVIGLSETQRPIGRVEKILMVLNTDRR